MPEEEHPTDHNQGQAPADAHEKPKKFVAKLAQRSLALGMVAGILGGGVYLLSQCHRQPPATASMPTLQNTPTVAPNPIALATPTILSTPSAPPASTPQSTPLASSSATPVPPPPAKDPFEDGMQHVLQAGSSGFRELRGNLTKTENATGPYPLFRSRKIYEGAFIFAGAYAAQLEEVYYSNANQPAYNYHLYFKDSSDKSPRYNDLRGRLDVMLRDFVHTSGTGYDAWTGSDARGTAVLLTDRDVLGSVEVKVHVAFPKPQW
jgi:hypothetical protein